MRCFPYLLLLALLLACTEKRATKAAKAEVVDTAPAQLPTPKPGEAIATFAGGCFWSMEADFELLRGVRQVVAGYAGGEQGQPTYEQVGTQQTGHAESVQVYYDPNLVSYDTLVKAFLFAHDPTTLNQQGPDVGTQYRSVAFYRTPAEKTSLGKAIARLNTSGLYTKPVVTQVVPFSVFYPAEGYHQGYYDTHPDAFYITVVSKPKVETFKEKLADKLKPETPAP